MSVYFEQLHSEPQQELALLQPEHPPQWPPFLRLRHAEKRIRPIIITKTDITIISPIFFSLRFNYLRFAFGLGFDYLCGGR